MLPWLTSPIPSDPQRRSAGPWSTEGSTGTGSVASRAPLSQRTGPGTLWVAVGVRASASSVPLRSIDARQRLVQILDHIGHVFDPG